LTIKRADRAWKEYADIGALGFSIQFGIGEADEMHSIDDEMSDNRCFETLGAVIRQTTTQPDQAGKQDQRKAATDMGQSKQQS
jgi:hypothetical protein